MTGSTIGALRWNAFSLLGKQIAQMTVALVVARIIGPEAYGVIGIATVFVTVATLLMDQGLSAALIQRPDLSTRDAGAATTANLLLAVVLSVFLMLVARPASEFFGLPELREVLLVLGAALLLKAPAIVPRALLSRQLRFRPLGLADLVSSFVAGITAVVAAGMGASYWAVVIQFVVIDAITMVWLLVAARPPLPNLDMRALRQLMGFSIRVLASSLLTSTSRNVDNVLVGRFLGTEAVGVYSLAYRVLMVPVQMLGMMTSRVLFPSFARSAGRPENIRRNVTRVTRVLATLAAGLMGLVAIAAHDGVSLVMGEVWLPAVPVIQVLAITGARQAIYSVTTPLMTGLGRADWHLRFAVVATLVQVAAIVAGLPFGVVGVAIGYTVAGFIMTPAMFWIQRRLVGESLPDHIGAILPPVLAALLAMGTYWAVGGLIVGSLSGLLVGGVTYAFMFTGSLWLLAPSYRRRLVADIRALLGR